jgi:hypothetical protein
MHTLRPILWGLHYVQGLSLHQLRQPNYHIFFQGLKWCTWLHPSYLLATIMAILPTMLMSATFLSRISFVINMGKRDIKMLFILSSSHNKSNSNYHNKICQYLSLPFNRNLRHFSLPFKLSPPKVILVRLLTRRSTMLTRGRCFKPMPLKLKLCKINSNHWGPNLLI